MNIYTKTWSELEKTLILLYLVREKKITKVRPLPGYFCLGEIQQISAANILLTLHQNNKLELNIHLD